jgi:hypothetical protein
MQQGATGCNNILRAADVERPNDRPGRQLPPALAGARRILLHRVI